MANIASTLGRWGISPNAISIAGMVGAISAGIALAATPSVTGASSSGLYLVAVLGMQFRLLCNLWDGMVAIEGNKRSVVGDLYNEVPDRVSDAAVLIGAGYAAMSVPWLGWLSATLAILTAYIRAVGKSAGLGNDFCGPMAKPHRMAVVTATCLVLSIPPARGLEWHGMGLMAAALAIVAGGSAATCIRRLRRQARALRSRAMGAHSG